ncbi:MAG TPA: 6-bladed beta-propeller [Nitrososphaeraceae archaeon]
MLFLFVFLTSFSFSSLIFSLNFSLASESGYQLQLRWGTEGTENGQFMVPHSMVFDSEDNIYVTDTNNHRIQKFTSDGEFITKWGTEGNGDGEFSSPEGIDVDSLGNVYVADTGNSRIQKFTSDGEFITKWGTEGNGDGEFGLPLGIGVTSKGDVFIIDQVTSSIHQFSNEGEFLNKIIFNFDKLEDIEIDSNDDIYVTDRNKNEILKFSKIIN